MNLLEKLFKDDLHIKEIQIEKKEEKQNCLEPDGNQTHDLFVTRCELYRCATFADPLYPAPPPQKESQFLKKLITGTTSVSGAMTSSIPHPFINTSFSLNQELQELIISQFLTASLVFLLKKIHLQFFLHGSKDSAFHAFAC